MIHEALEEWRRTAREGAALALDRGEERGRVPPSQQHARRTEKDREQHAVDEARHVRDGRRHHEHVVGVDPVVLRLRRALVEQGRVGMQHALGLRGRT